MCTTCEQLEAKVGKAAAEQNDEKARVMRALLASHQKYSHPLPVIVWPNGVSWVVRV